MKIIIVGAGRVGSSVAESLVSEQNDITVIDADPARVADLQDRFDLRGLVGNAALPSTLKQAGADDSDMLIAVTAFDETNLVACKIAADLFNVPTRIARVRNVELQQHPQLIGEQGFRCSHVIFPEQTVTDTLLNLTASNAFVGILSLGMVFLLAMREIDLSIGWMFNFSAVVCALAIRNGVDPFLAAGLGIVFGACLGVFNGLLAVGLRPGSGSAATAARSPRSRTGASCGTGTTTTARPCSSSSA